LVISAEVHERLQQRNKRIDAELDKISAAHEAKQKLLNGTGPDVIREVEGDCSLVHPGPITLPGVALRTSSWWKMLASGDAGAQISVEAAQYIIKTISVDALGAQRASQVKVNLDGSTLALRDVWDAVQGFGGWEALIARGSSDPLAGPCNSAGRVASA
jgi:hypothetical protein